MRVRPHRENSLSRRPEHAVDDGSRHDAKADRNPAGEKGFRRAASDPHVPPSGEAISPAAREGGDGAVPREPEIARQRLPAGNRPFSSTTCIPGRVSSRRSDPVGSAVAAAAVTVTVEGNPARDPVAWRAIRGRHALALLLAALFAVSSGCTTGAAKNPGPHGPMTKTRLIDRVQEFWTAWQEHDLHRVFLLYAPSYRRKTGEPAFYEVTRGMLGIHPQEYEIREVEMSESGRAATVRIDSFAILPPLGRVPSRLEQKWVYEEGDWYRVMEAFSPPPPAPSAGAARSGGREEIRGEPSDRHERRGFSDRPEWRRPAGPLEPGLRTR